MAVAVHDDRTENSTPGMRYSTRWWCRATIQHARGYASSAAVRRRYLSTEIIPSALVKEKCASAFELSSAMPSPSSAEEGLGIALLNSNAEAHFSFTNALGMISVERYRRLAAAVDAYPRACWIIALHHH